MIILLLEILFLATTYFVAAIPFGLVLTKIFAKKDVREFGSKNIGATNVTRVAGKKLGFITLILDGIKGAIMVIIARYCFSDAAYLHWFLVLVAFTAVCAHVYPIYLNYKGGKGVATAIAVIFALDPVIGFLVVCFWIMAFSLFKISSVSSLIAIFSTIPLSYHFHNQIEQIIFAWALFFLILVRHKENISRLLMGEEKPIEKKENKDHKKQ